MGISIFVLPRTPTGGVLMRGRHREFARLFHKQTGMYLNYIPPMKTKGLKILTDTKYGDEAEKFDISEISGFFSVQGWDRATPPLKYGFDDVRSYLTIQRRTKNFFNKYAPMYMGKGSDFKVTQDATMQRGR